MALFYSFLWLNNISLYICTTSTGERRIYYLQQVRRTLRIFPKAVSLWTTKLGKLFFFFFWIFEFHFIYFFIQQVLISYLFYTHQFIHVNPNLPVHPTTAPPLSPLVSIRLFSTSVSLFLQNWGSFKARVPAYSWRGLGSCQSPSFSWLKSGGSEKVSITIP